MNERLKNNNCSCEQIREPGPFAGWSDFDAFAKALKSTTAFSQVPVKSPHSNVGLLEHWYKCVQCHSTWRLVEPDPPFAGLWERVS
jgi:hypothetical protein